MMTSGETPQPVLAGPWAEEDELLLGAQGDVTGRRARGAGSTHAAWHAGEREGF